MRFTAVTARGTEDVLADELRALGAEQVEPGRGHLAFEGELDIGYRACMFARSASRILLPIARFEAGGGEADPEALYDGIYAIDWLAHIAPNGTLAVECVTAAGVAGHTRFLAQKTKDAICDQLRARKGERPSVDRDRPDVRVHIHLGEEATVSIDLSGEAMHRRSYRTTSTAAPIKENLAAALLLMAGWRERAAQGAPLIDPLCGSGTFLIEGALIAGDIAPGLLREHHGMLRWRGHDPRAWSEIEREAQERARAGRAAIPEIIGFDRSDSAVRAARDAARRANVADHVRVEVQALAEASPGERPPGLLMTNPPYGERLGAEGELIPLYEQLGDVLKQRFAGWNAFVLTGSPILAKSIGLRAAKRTPIWNGPIECRLLEIPMAAAPAQPGAVPRWRKPSEESSAFANRLRKNKKRWSTWAEREQIECYRVYDGDIPEFNVAIDLYGAHAVVQEYVAPRSVDPKLAARRLRDIMMLVPELLELPKEAVSLKVRKRQTDGGQYTRRDGESTSARQVVTEGGLKLAVSFDDHLDTGLFPDHRQLRAIAAEAAQGRSFLNLFAYTCTAGVYAARAGATRTTNVDLSNTYLEWGHANYALNAIDTGGSGKHRFLQTDCLKYLAELKERFGVVFLNPPSYSRSHRMQGDFDIQRDHAALIRAAVARLEPEGVLFFSTHAQRFALAAELAETLDVEDIHARTVPKDFERSPHAAFRIRRRV
jgi:23S rRNA (guanine2445-N2)-methyltransferase / 23S rRNA (guanine2069-N7)-methyltransferase